MAKKENQFTAKLEKFNKKGEKSGWTYIAIPASMAEAINAGVKKSFRVKGSIDLVKIKQVALLPIGGGEFILPINQKIKKELKKDIGDKVTLTL
nr:DUF1905 domain-containing protein [Cyclobacteriaceae bacterium]